MDSKVNTEEQTSSKWHLIVKGLYSFGDKAAALILGFITLWILLRITSQEVFGVWVFFQGVVATIEVARSGILQNALIRYLTNSEKSEHGAIYGGAWLLNLIIASIGFLIFIFSGSILEELLHYPNLSSLMQIYALTFLVTTPLWQFNYIQQAYLEFRGAFWATILRYTTMFCIAASIYFQLIDVDLNSYSVLFYLAWGQLIASVLSTSISYIFAKPFIPKNLVFSKAWALKLVHFGKYVFGTNLSSMLYKLVDTAMLGALLISSAPTAIYGLAIRITNFVDVPTLSVASIVFPESSRISGQGPEAQARMYEKAVAAILAFVLPALIVVMIFPQVFVNILGGSDYAETIPILQITVLYSLFVPFGNQFGTLLDASGDPKTNFKFTVVGMLLNAILNYLFISNYGIYGAPLGTLITYMIMFIAMQLLLYQKFGVQLLNIAKELPKTYQIIWQFIISKLSKSGAK